MSLYILDLFKKLFKNDSYLASENKNGKHQKTLRNCYPKTASQDVNKTKIVYLGTF